MSRRIVKETLKDGKIQFRVETNKLFGFIPWKWHTDIQDIDYGYYVSRGPAVFYTLEDAKEHIEQTTWSKEKNPVVKREIL